MKEKSPPLPGDTVRRVTGWVVIILVGSLVLHIATQPKKIDPELEADEASASDQDLALQDSAAGSSRFVFTQVAYPPIVQLAGTQTKPGMTNPLNANRAYGYLKQLCELGPRPSGSRGMKAQQKLLVEHFKSLGAEVDLQRFKEVNPLGGPKVRMANVVARWRHEAKNRLLLCAHYDTRPLPDRDPDRRARREGTFIGANDGASGVAVLMELAHQLQNYEGQWGIDCVLFDGEELVYVDRRDPYFLGSEYFARQYRKEQANRDWQYDWAILLDMVGDADLQLYYERNSYAWPETRPLVRDLWATAEKLRLEEFIPKVKHEVLDDHLALRRLGGIKAIDIIDFDYPHWHTEEDTAEKCSGESLSKVGWVVWTWIQQSSEP